MPKLILVRGIPGTGKSTYAKAIVDEYSHDHFEADMWFMRNGQYQFNASQLGQAHDWCQKQVYNSMRAGRNVIVSNVFTRRHEMNVYIAMAELMGYTVEIVSLTHEYGSVHGVSDKRMARFRARWEK